MAKQSTNKPGKSSSRTRRKKSLPRSKSSLLDKISVANPAFLVVVPLGKPASVIECHTREKFRETICEWLGEDAQVFLFQGRRHHLTQGPFHYLVAADNEREPLFELPPAAEAVVCEEGFVGDLYEESEEAEEEAPVEEEEEEIVADFPRVQREDVDDVEEEQDDEWYGDE